MMKLGKTNFSEEVASDWRGLTQSQKWLFVLYTLLLVSYTRNIIYAIETRIGLSALTDYTDIFLYVILAFGCFRIFLQKIKKTDLFFLLVVIVIHILSWAINKDTASLSEDNALLFFGSCLPMFLVGLTVDKKTPISLFVVMAYIALFLSFLYFSVFGLGEDETGNAKVSSMDYAFKLLPFTCLLLYNAFERRGVFHWIIGLVALFLLLSYGVRGAVVAVLFFIVFYLIVYKHYTYNAFIKILTVVLAYIIFVYIDVIAMTLMVISQQLGLSTRIFESVLDDKMINFSESSYRDVIWNNVINTLKANGNLLDCNLYVDRFYNGMELFYVHNLELELLCDFGWIGGTLLIVFLFLYIFRAFKGVWNTSAAALLLVFFSSTVMQLQFSGSFLMSPLFWFFLGMCSTMIHEGKRRKSTSFKL